MNLNHLAIFHAAVIKGGFTRGAEHLKISQPAVSKQIKELEEWIGTPLVNRSQKTFRLTEAGELLASYAQRIFALETEAERAMEEYRGLRRGRLAVGASTTIGIYVLPVIFGLYRKQYPGIDLSLEIGNTEQIQQLLVDRALHVGLTEGLAENPELDPTVFMNDTLVTIAPPTSPLLEKRGITAAELCRQPLIFREMGSGTRAVIERALARKGLLARPIMTLGSTEAIKRAVAAGMGLGIVSRLTVEIEVTDHRLALLPISDLTFRRPLHLLLPHGQQLYPATQRFLELLKIHLQTRSCSS